MTGVDAGYSHAGSDLSRIRALRSREAGYSIARKCLEIQGDVRDHLLPDAESWYIGTLGEMRVGRLLEKLGPDWLVLHSVPFGSADTDIDHLIVGPRGIFTLNTKHHRGASIWIVDSHMRVDNIPNQYLKASVGEAKRVAERLKRKTGLNHEVTPVLVMVAPSKINDKRERSELLPAVVDDAQLVGWLQQCPIASPEEIELVKLLAEEPDTWHIDPHASDTLRVMQRFDRLRTSVGTTAGRQRTIRASTPRSGPPRAPRAGRGRSRQKESLLARLLRLTLSLVGLYVAYQVVMSMLASRTGG